MNTMIQIMVGDMSGDGHNITETTSIKSNKSYDDVREAYKKGCEIVGFDLTETVCKEYEDSHLDEDKAIALQNAGFDLTDLQDFDDDLEDINLIAEDFLTLYLNICQIGDPSFQYEYASMRQLKIGGYGLFN